MNFLEFLLILVSVAVVLLWAARRLRLPYPALIAAAGVAVAAVPGMPTIPIDPKLALALFIAPILVDAAYDFPLVTARKLMVPLIVFAVGAVLVTAFAVALIGWWAIGLPFAVALTLGAIVAPPDAAAATAVISGLPVARRVDAVLRGESLFNDATALILFGVAISVQQGGGLTGDTLMSLSIAAPGGILFGIAYGMIAHRLGQAFENTVGGTLIQFVHAFATWIIAEHLHLSAVLATVASAMTIARVADVRASPRMRVHSYAVWTTVVFLLNVLAFLLMGMQGRRIVTAMSATELVRAAWFAAAVVATVVVVRIVIAFAYRLVVVWRWRREVGPEPISAGETLLVGWTGMRGLVTLATAFALPANFPDRDPVVLAAFAVVLATLVLQGLTLVPLIRRLGLNREADGRAELAVARADLADAALARLAGEEGAEAEALRHAYTDLRVAEDDHDARGRLHRHHGLAIAAVIAQRERLEELRETHRIGAEVYLQLQEALDWKQLAMSSDEERRIVET